MVHKRKQQSPAPSVRRQFSEMVLRAASQDGLQATAIPALSFMRASSVSEPLPTLYEPSLFVIAQGAKAVTFGEASYIYNTDSYLAASVSLPITGQIIEASSETPYVCVKLRFSADQIIDIVQNMPPLDLGPQLNRGISVCSVSDGLLDAMMRLVSLLDTPQDIPFLAPLIIKEILYRAILDDPDRLVSQIAVGSDNAIAITKAIAIINEDYAKPLRIDELARAISLSPSALHHQFKRVTAMSPLQYQKQIRLQEARRLLIAESLEAADVSYKVGYESPSQFSREYARMFGLPPIRDAKRLRDTVSNEGRMNCSSP